MIVWWKKKRLRWSNPKGFSTPFALDGDPLLGDGVAGIERRRELYMQVFGSVSGRTVLADILARSGIGAPVYQPGVDRDTMVYLSGMQAMALDIAMLAGLNTAALGRAAISSKLEAMIDEDEPADEEPADWS